MLPSPATARIACTSPPFVERATAAELEGWLDYFDPDLVVLTGESAAPWAASVLRQHVGPETTFFQPAGYAPASGPRTINGVQFMSVPTMKALDEIAEYERDEFATDVPTYVLSGLLELEVDTTTLSTSLVGRSIHDWSTIVDEVIRIAAGLPQVPYIAWDVLPIGGGDFVILEINSRGSLISTADGR